MEQVVDNSGAPLKRPASLRRRRILLGLLLALGVGASSGVGAERWVTTSTSGEIYDDLAAVPAKPVALVFGAGVTPNREPTLVLRERIVAAVQLYKAGKVRKLLMTGDNGRAEYDEVTAMKEYAIRLGVPARDIVRDYAGFRTYDSCYRAKVIFGVDDAVLVTQRFHLPRAMFIARRLGMDAVGYVAAPGLTDEQLQAMSLREMAARPTAILDSVIFRRQPRFLGPREPLFENERDDR